MNIFSDQSWIMAIQLIAAIVLALPTAYNREANSRIMGLRTFPLVSLGACAYILVATSFIGSDDPGAMARILAGLLTGMGFIGGGAIVKNDNHVKGTESAASIWITGALGASVGLQLWSLALMLSMLNFLVIWAFGFLKEKVTESETIDD